VKLRLRTEEKLRTAQQDYAASARALESTALSDGVSGPVDSIASGPAEELPAQIAYEHGQTSIDMVTPVSFNARSFLLAVVRTTDPAVGTDTKMAAARLCERITERDGSSCVCAATWSARDQHEFRDWIEDATAAGLRSDEEDVGLAALVREYGRGRSDRDLPIHPSIRRALDDVVSFELARAAALPDAWAEEDRRIAETARDRLLQSVWETVLSPGQIKAKHRLDAYRQLERARALRECVCAPKRWLPDFPPPAPEIEAYDGTIRLLVHRTRRSALLGVQFPETCNALREMPDRQIIGVAAAGDSVVFACDDATRG
jgi:hypothetical protein